MDFDVLREKMVADQLVSRGINTPEVIEAMRRVPRHEFVPLEEQPNAYDDRPVFIGHGQTISQPYIVALMTQSLRLKKDDRVLEVGTGCGYQTAVLAELCKEIYTIERLPELSQKAQAVLKKLNYQNIHFKIGDGTLGWSREIPFDAILVAAAAPNRETPLFAHLKEGGRMIIPIGDRSDQSLFCISKKEGLPVTEEICRCVFVPLVGEFGWQK